MNKRGLSDVITTLLVILLVLVAMGVVWGIIRNIIRSGSKDISLSGFTLDLEIKDAYESGDNIIVKVERKVGEGNLKGIKFILSNGDDEVIEKSTTMGELEQETFTLTPANPSAVQTVSIAPIYETGGEENVGNIVDTYTVRRGDEGGGEEGGEEVEDEEGAVCGNLIVETGEECDSDGINNCIDTGFPDECTCEAGFVPDPESNGCIVDESVVCDGVFDGNEQCDGGADCIALGEPNECTCPNGFDPDGFGGCIAWVVVNTGLVEEVWPPDTGMYFASSDLPTYTDYVSYYVSYTGAIECALIVNYVTPDISGYDKTHIAFSFDTDIEVGDTYEIWETVPKCEASLEF